jgi:DNA repair protein RecO (recombination protein O)
MEWVDEGIILGVRKHGETSAIVEVMTRHHGRHMGLVRGGRSRRMQPVLQPGNSADLVWRARLDEQLGTFQIEPVKMRAAQLMETAIGIHGIQAMAAYLRLLPERDAHESLFEIFEVIIGNLDKPEDAGELFIRFELSMLYELGFGLDLSKCAATGVTDKLIYISPKSGRAVSEAAGEQWKDKLFKFPDFLVDGSIRAASRHDLIEAFKVTNFFFDRHIYGPRAIDPPLSRDGFVQAVLKGLAAA